MSYGDDADSPWDRESRIKYSKKWHEQNQLRHKCSYPSSSKLKTSYKPNYSKTYYKPKRSSKYVSPIAVCPVCHKKYEKKLYVSCPYCRKSKSHKSSSKHISHAIKQNNMFIKCPICGKLHDKNTNECPYCKISKSSETSSNQSKAIFALCLILIIIIALITMFLL